MINTHVLPNNKTEDLQTWPEELPISWLSLKWAGAASKSHNAYFPHGAPEWGISGWPEVSTSSLKGNNA